MSENAQYRLAQIRQVLAAGPAQGEDFFRIKVTGATSSHWFNISPFMLDRIAAAVAVTEVPPCEHPLQDFQLIEEGYVRGWRTYFNEDEHVIDATSDGWGDFSDDGDGSYLQCTVCGHVKDVPESYEINYL